MGQDRGCLGLGLVLEVMSSNFRTQGLARDSAGGQGLLSLCWPGTGRHDSWPSGVLGLQGGGPLSELQGGGTGIWSLRGQGGKGHHPCGRAKSQSSERPCLVHSRCRVNPRSVWSHVWIPASLPDARVDGGGVSAIIIWG